MDKRKILFITGTRADYGKLKPLMQSVEQHDDFALHVFVTGMHMHKLYGNTYLEVFKDGYENIFRYFNSSIEEGMDQTLARTIQGVSDYVQEIPVDLIVIHGDRVEALAGAIVGSLNNILVAHIEGGELSGTIDELIRHSVSKMSHTHFVANEEAEQRLIQLGELPSSIYIIGSPDIDVMFSDNLPSIDKVKSRYDILFDEYGVVLFHPVTTEVDDISRQANNLVTALKKSSKNYVVIYPNNDNGSHFILNAYEALEESDSYKLLPSMRFEYFLSLLKNASICIGNSSAGIREAPCYGIPTVNIGSRQENRTSNSSIIHTDYTVENILSGITNALDLKHIPESKEFGDGKSSIRFLKILESNKFWETNKQKQFLDLDF